ncbi:MAG: ribbon-helix-helix domain-containing protein [Candidatus Bipolaricaulota bacterium]|nr:ribbon-helix-helix domain-containing protein [Candidatus Bipolaricaulota bacterium]MCS7274193.1 ribbon-helix-helix domain-containing protein [Candidatus Bipolaricaulota bacterium]MDW8110099.1 CopG family transcriptional regulator [Candidatus Bipolaricaulota bacterium]MDW8328981.1 CopG family transcriptional regulator [Candidatus Bipolaricaulota bacterium]
MHRTQVLLTEEQVRRLKEEAAQRGVSMAKIIREALQEHLARQQGQWRELCRRSLAAVGRFASGCHDVSKEHDRELEGAYADT